MYRKSPPPKEWVIVLLVGVCLLPFSPIIALIGMFGAAWLLSQPSIFNGFSFKTHKRIEKEEREELSANMDEVFICPTCGAVYTKEFVSLFHNEPKCINYLHYETKPHFPRGSVENCETKCFYCDNPVFKAHETQGFYERQANNDDLNVLGRNDFRKPLRFVRYVLRDHPILPDGELNAQYEFCVKLQVLVLYSLWIEILNRNNPGNERLNRESNDLLSLRKYRDDMQYKMDIRFTRKMIKWDFDARKFKDYDIWYNTNADKPE